MAEPYRVVEDELFLCRFVHAPAHKQVDTTGTSGAESLTSQGIVEIGNHLHRQVREHPVSDAGEDAAVNQIAVPALGVAVPPVSVGGEPLIAPLPDRQGIFFLHIIASFLANEPYHRKLEIAAGKNGILAKE